MKRKMNILGRIINNKLERFISVEEIFNYDRNDRLKDFEKHLMYVILEFLSQDTPGADGPDELFIRMPVEELSENVEEQQAMFNEVQGIMALCLVFSTINQFWDSVKIPNGSEYPGDWYTSGDAFCSLANPAIWTCNQNTIFKNCQRRRDGELPGGIINNEDFFRLPNRNTNIGDGVEIVKNIKLILDTALVGNIRQFTNAAFVSINNISTPKMKKYPIVGEEICLVNNKTPIVNYVTNINELNGADVPNPEIIIGCGDNAVRIGLNYYRHRPHNKIIYFATNLSDSDNIPTYSFSIREMFYYLGLDPDNNMPILFSVDFPWYKKVIDNLGNVLRENEIIGDDAEIIKKRFFNMISSLSFSGDRLDEIKNGMTEWLRNQCNTSDELIERINTDFFSGLEYNSDTNPKKEKLNEYFKEKNIDSNDVLYLDNDFSRYKEKVRGFSGNYIVINSAFKSTHPEYVDSNASHGAAEYCLRYFPAKKIISVYYNEWEGYRMENMKKYLEKELGVENSDLRRKYGTDNDMVELFGLDGIDTDDYSNEQESVQVMLDGNYNTTSLTDGVLRDGVSYRQIDINALKEYVNNNRINIKYYSQPEDFIEIIKHIETIQCIDDDNKVSYWIDFCNGKIKEYLRKQRNMGYISGTQLINGIASRTGININIIYKISASSYHNLFDDRIESLCKFLLDEGMITNDESEKIYKCKKKMDIISQKIKNEIYSYLINPNRSDDLPILNAIINNSGQYTMDGIIERCIREGQIVRIIS